MAYVDINKPGTCLSAGSIYYTMAHAGDLDTDSQETGSMTRNDSLNHFGLECMRILNLQIPHNRLLYAFTLFMKCCMHDWQ